MITRALILAAFLLLLPGCSSLLYYPYDGFAVSPAKMKHAPEDIVIETEDGTKIHAWYFKAPTKPKGTLLFFHGNAQNLTTHFYNLYWILEQGYDYLIFDYRGYGMSEGKPNPEGTLKDGKAALRWIAKHKRTKSLYLFGQSLGGAVLLRTACDLKGEVAFDRIVVDSTFSSYKRAGQKLLSRSWITWAFQWLPFLVLSDEYAPKACVETLSPTPLLVVHGTDDPTIAFSLGEKIYETAREPKEFWRVEGGKHTDFLFRDHNQFQSKLITWLETPVRPQSEVESIDPLTGH